MGCLCVWSIAQAQTLLQKQSNNDGSIRNIQPTALSDVQLRPVLLQTTSSSKHLIRSSIPGNAEAIRQYLQSKNSPLAAAAEQISQSPYWAIIIAICTIEEYNCSVNPADSFNFWGITPKKNEPYFTTKDGRRFRKYSSMEEGIMGIESFLQSAEDQGRTSVESFRGWYCASECSSWESTVVKTKLKLEN